MNHNGVSLASFHYISAANLDPEEWTLVAAQDHLGVCLLEYSVDPGWRSYNSVQFLSNVGVLVIWVMTSVVQMNQVVQLSNRKHTYMYSCNCIVPANSGTLKKSQKNVSSSLMSPRVQEYLPDSFHGLPTLAVKLKRLRCVITRIAEDHLHSSLEHSRDGADSCPHLCHWPVQLGLVQHSLTELL